MILDMIARLPGLTEVDGSMIPLEEHDDTTRDSKLARGRFGCIDLIVYISITMAGGLYLYPGLKRVVKGLSKY